MLIILYIIVPSNVEKQYSCITGNSKFAVCLALCREQYHGHTASTIYTECQTKKLTAKIRHTTNWDFAECDEKTHGKMIFCRVPNCWHTTKINFAVTSLWHTAKSELCRVSLYGTRQIWFLFFLLNFFFSPHTIFGTLCYNIVHL